MSEQFSNPEQALIERLRRAPQPELPAEAREIIRVRILDALNHPPIPAPRPPLFHPVVVTVVLLIIATLVAGGVLLVLSRQNQVVPLSTATNEPRLTVSPTATVEPTLTAIPVMISSPVLTATSTLTPSSEATQSPTPPPLTSGSTVTVVQGPVERIDGNVVTIYGIQVQIAPNDPILGTIAVGDVIRVKGNQSGTSPIIIVAATVVFINVNGDSSSNDSTNGNVSTPSSGSNEGWTDDGTCDHPPPDWAPANGWRRRCQGQESNNSSNNNGSGNNNGNGNNNGSGNGNKPNKNNP